MYKRQPILQGIGDGAYNNGGGEGKSSLILAFAPHRDMASESVDLGASQKEIMELTLGKMIIELPEMCGMSKADRAALKRFFTQIRDEARLAYDAVRSTRYRRYVMWRTSNNLELVPLGEGGERRYLPVQVALQPATKSWVNFHKEREQIYAEAVHLADTGEVKLYLEGKMAEAQQELIRRCVILSTSDIELT